MGFKRSWVRIPPARYHYVLAMFHVYVLRSSKSGRRYVGSCENLGERVRRHNLGHSKATLHRIPSTLIYSESFSNRTEAARQERYYKSGRCRDTLDQLRL